MPIQFHLNGQRLDPEILRVMGLAYEMALLVLQRTGGTTNRPVRRLLRRLSTLQKLASATQSNSVMKP